MEEETAWTTKRQIGGTYLKKKIMSLDRQLPPKVHHDVVPTHTSRLQFERLRYPHESYPARTPDPRGAWGWRVVLTSSVNCSGGLLELGHLG